MNDSLHTVYIGLGTNLGDRLANLAAARQALPPNVLLLEASPIYETRPWGYADQPDFLNQVVKAQTGLAPMDLLTYLKQCEVRLGRTPTFKNGPRQVDLDLLFFDDLVLDSPTLTVPHLGIPERAFVLAPLADIAPDYCHPVSGKTVKQLLEGVDTTDVKKIYP
jgi:2-amino-4-hydroxy-6-hydroxymethyldihydropteridine diphosphokinase